MKKIISNTSILVIFTLIALSLVLSLIAISMNISECVITDESIVLLFVGILATFIVIGNQFQTYIMEHRIKEMEVRNNEMLNKQKYAYKQLLSSTKSTILSIVHMQLKMQTVNYNNAFLYALDLIPILPELYGENSFESDIAGEHLNNCIEVFDKILDENKNASAKCEIQATTIERALIELDNRLPATYHKRKEIEEIKIRLKNELKSFNKKEKKHVKTSY